MITPLFKPTVHARRRKLLARDFEAATDLLILFTAPHQLRNHDSSYPYRWDSDFFYLTGFQEPESALLMWTTADGKKQKVQEQIFVPPKDKSKEQWDGFRFGVDGTKKAFGFESVFEFQALEQSIVDWLNKIPSAGRPPRIWSNATAYPAWKAWLDQVLARYQPAHRVDRRPIESVGDVRPRIGALRLVKDADEIKTMKRASQINVAAHLEVLKTIKSGIGEYDVQAVVEGEYLKRGAHGPSYTTICAAGENATILHYIRNSEKLKKGDLFLIDAGCEYASYASDITRTYPVNGKFSREQKILMDLVMRAHAAALSVVKPKVPYIKIHEASTQAIVEGLRDLGILKGSVAKILETQKHKRYFPHGTGHWLGLDVHDACPYFDRNGKSLELRPGMVFTVEPGVYFLPDDTSVAPKWRGLGVRIEDDVLVTSKGYEILTEGLPRTADEIEAFMKSRKTIK